MLPVTVPIAQRAFQFVLPEWMFIYSGVSIRSVVIWVNISFQPNEEQNCTFVTRPSSSLVDQQAFKEAAVIIIMTHQSDKGVHCS